MKCASDVLPMCYSLQISTLYMVCGSCCACGCYVCEDQNHVNCFWKTYGQKHTQFGLPAILLEPDEHAAPIVRRWSESPSDIFFNALCTKRVQLGHVAISETACFLCIDEFGVEPLHGVLHPLPVPFPCHNQQRYADIMYILYSLCVCLSNDYRQNGSPCSDC